MEISTNILLLELIKAGGNILSAVIPCVVTFVLGKRFLKIVKLKQDYITAMNDIRYLLGVEDLHCREHFESHGKSLRQTIRTAVNVERRLEWSGKYTPSQIGKRIDKLNNVKPQKETQSLLRLISSSFAGGKKL